jgi:hypothetical protein
LQQCSASGAEEKGGFAIDLPTHGGWAEDARRRICATVRDGRKKRFDVSR